jgi:hypothetical protein
VVSGWSSDPARPTGLLGLLTHDTISLERAFGVSDAYKSAQVPTGGVSLAFRGVRTRKKASKPRGSNKLRGPTKKLKLLTFGGGIQHVVGSLSGYRHMVGRIFH